MLFVASSEVKELGFVITSQKLVFLPLLKDFFSYL